VGDFLGDRDIVLPPVENNSPLKHYQQMSNDNIE
jgi:hypothetical protein